jgi:hypothetical protein
MLVVSLYVTKLSPIYYLQHERLCYIFDTTRTRKVLMRKFVFFNNLINEWYLRKLKLIKVHVNQHDFVSDTQTPSRSWFLLCFLHELLTSSTTSFPHWTGGGGGGGGGCWKLLFCKDMIGQECKTGISIPYVHNKFCQDCSFFCLQQFISGINDGEPRVLACELYLSCALRVVCKSLISTVNIYRHWITPWYTRHDYCVEPVKYWIEKYVVDKLSLPCLCVVS